MASKVRNIPRDPSAWSQKRAEGSTQGVRVVLPDPSMEGTTTQRTNGCCQNFLKEKSLFTNPLSRVWNLEGVRKNPAVIPLLVVAYPLGMVGYLLSLPLRIAIFVKDIFLFVGTFFAALACDREHFGERMRERGLYVVCSLAEVGTALLGTVCPPLAYALEEQLHGQGGLHAYGTLTRWVGPEDAEGANTKRQEIKKDKVHQEIEFFKMGKDDLETVVNPNEVAGMTANVMNAILRLGVLRAFINGKLDGIKATVLDYKEEEADQEAYKTLYNANVGEIKRLWKTLSQEIPEQQTLFTYFLLETAQIGKPEDDDEWFQDTGKMEGWMKQRDEALEAMNLKEAFGNVNKCLKNLAYAIQEDVELFNVIMREVFSSSA